MKTVLLVLALYGVSCLSYGFLKLLSDHQPDNPKFPTNILFYVLYLVGFLGLVTLGSIDRHLAVRSLDRRQKEKKEHLATYRATLQRFRKERIDLENRIDATPAEMCFAAGIVSGIYTEKDIPLGVNSSTVEKLITCYIREYTLANPGYPYRDADTGTPKPVSVRISGRREYETYYVCPECGSLVIKGGYVCDCGFIFD